MIRGSDCSVDDSLNIDGPLQNGSLIYCTACLGELIHYGWICIACGASPGFCLEGEYPEDLKMCLQCLRRSTENTTQDISAKFGTQRDVSASVAPVSWSIGRLGSRFVREERFPLLDPAVIEMIQNDAENDAAASAMLDEMQREAEQERDRT